MKPHLRRQEAAYPYYKLAKFDAVSLTFRDGKVAFTTEHEARAAAKSPGKYRLSVVTDVGRDDLAPFTVT